MIIVRANARNATYISDDLITSGSVGIPVTFNLSEDFDGLSCIAVFEGSGASIDVALMGDSCVVPHEVLATAGGYLRIGIYASNSAGTIVIPTVWAGSKMILQGTTPSEVDPSEPTPSWVAQVQEAAAEALANSEEAIEIAGGAEAAAEEARQSASAAATSATAAEQSASAAGASQTAADAASGAAASARDAAVAAQSGAESSASAAAGSATAAAGSAAAAAASEAAAKTVEESIPADYTDLSNDVSELKSQMNTAIELIQEGTTNAIDGYYLDSNGNLVANSEYMVSDFIALTNPGGAITWHYGAGLDTFAKGVAYQADKTTKTITSPIVSWEERTDIQFSSSYVYLRISIKKANAGSTFVSQSSTVLYDKPFAHQSLDQLYAGVRNVDEQIDIINHTIYDQKNATDNCRLNSDGDLVTDPDYMVSDYIPILSPGNYITWHYGLEMNTDAKAFVYQADKTTKRVINPIASLAERSDLIFTDTYVYMRISIKKANASTTTVKQGTTILYQNPVAESGMNERMDTVPFYTPFIVGTYNVRSYQGATGPDSNAPLTPEQIAVILPEMREALSRITADVLVCSEDYRNWFDGSIGDTTGTKQVPVYENLYEHYYPYYYKTSFLDFCGPNIYSKYPIIDKGDILPDYSPYTSRRKISFAVIDYFGKHICIIGCHAEPGDSAQSAEMRAAYFTAINAKAAEYDFVVIAGDTNVFATSELTDVFSESVYQLGNRGYFGTIRTYVSQNYAFDNIITKGFTINNFNVVDVEYSDHYPCNSKVNFRL